MWEIAETPSPAATNAAISIPANWWWVPMIVLAFLMLLAFVGLFLARQRFRDALTRDVATRDVATRDTSTVSDGPVRAWIAIALVAGLLLMGLLVLTGSDSDLRNLVIGAVVTAAGTTVAFYFATKANENATASLLTVVGPSAGSLTAISVNTIAIERPDGVAIDYHFKITNVSSDTLADVQLIDSLLTPDMLVFDWPDPSNVHVLRGHESATVTGQYTILVPEREAGRVTDRATATAVKPSGEKVTSAPEVSVTQLREALRARS